MDQEAEIYKPRGTQNDFLTRRRSRQPYWNKSGQDSHTRLQNSRFRTFSEGAKRRKRDPRL